MYKTIISIIDGAILCETSSSADIEYGTPRMLLLTTFMGTMETCTIPATARRSNKINYILEADIRKCILKYAGTF